MKRALTGLIVAAAAASGALGGMDAGGSNGGLQAFGTGTVTITSPNSATIDNAAGQFGGVYVQSKNESGLPLSDVHVSFVSTGFETGGAPRFSIPINTAGPSGGGGSVAGYAFIDAQGCGGTPGSTTTVSTDSPTCGVNFQSVEYPQLGDLREPQSHLPDVPGSFPVHHCRRAGELRRQRHRPQLA